MIVSNNNTLFLDRDGVINEKLENDYVKSWEEFIFLKGGLEAIKNLSCMFNRIIIVTNQQGIAKGLMSQESLKEIHSKMLNAISDVGGKIDKIYAATDSKHDLGNIRKPNIAMGLMAKIDFPGIEFKDSIMVGDSDSDMEFGNRLGMKCVKICNSSPNKKFDYLCFKSLKDFSDEVSKI